MLLPLTALSVAVLAMFASQVGHYRVLLVVLRLRRCAESTVMPPALRGHRSQARRGEELAGIVRRGGASRPRGEHRRAGDKNISRSRRQMLSACSQKSRSSQIKPSAVHKTAGTGINQSPESRDADQS
jgi:hypothetical protein